MNQKVIDALNAARAREITAITQYMIQHYELEDQDYGKLADRMKDIAIQEMKHAEQFAERILFLNGVPGARPETPALKGQPILKMLETDIGLEEGAVQMYNDSAKLCRAEGDNGSMELFEHILMEEEDHLDEFQNLHDRISELGAAYLATLVERS